MTGVTTFINFLVPSTLPLKHISPKDSLSPFAQLAPIVIHKMFLGLYIEGARWNDDKQALDDPFPKELFSKMPIIHLLPVKDRPAPAAAFTVALSTRYVF